MSELRPSVPTTGRWQVLAWALWDCGSTGFSAVAVTFVFSVYLVKRVGAGLGGDISPAGWLGWAMFVAGVVIALSAPLFGVWVNAPHRRRTVLGLLTGLAVLFTAAMSLIREDPSYLWAGLVLLAVAVACAELAFVPYNAMLRQVSTPETSGRISGFGAAVGYGGSVVLLMVVYVGFTYGDGATRGALGIPAADGYDVRVVMPLTAAWFLVLALPVLIAIPAPPAAPDRLRVTSVAGAYRKLWSDIVSEWRRDRNVVYFLLASAVFRDGLAGVFAFGAVLGASVYGVSQANLVLFGVSALVIAALGAALGGLVDDRVGSKRIIVGSLACMIGIGLALVASSGQLAFWVCGLMLALFVGPAQASARALLLRMTAHGKEGVAFGLYTLTGKAISPLSPFLFSTFIAVFGTDRAGMGGLVVVLAAGLVAILFVRVPRRPAVV